MSSEVSHAKYFGQNFQQNFITTDFVAAIKIYINSLICNAMGYDMIGIAQSV
jgi:hypothetical protein